MNISAGEQQEEGNVNALMSGIRNIHTRVKRIRQSPQEKVFLCLTLFYKTVIISIIVKCLRLHY